MAHEPMSADTIARNSTLQVMARLVQLAGIPLGLGALSYLSVGIIDLKTQVASLTTQVSAVVVDINHRIDTTERRIDRLEDRIDGVPAMRSRQSP